MKRERVERKLHNDRKSLINNGGYSIIELIIVLAIIAIIMSSVFYSIVLVFSANAKSCANNIQRSIGDCKVTTMGKSEAYMRLYRDTDGSVYTEMYVAENGAAPALSGERQKVGTNKVEVGYVDGSDIPLLEGDEILISFDRSNGGFSDKYDRIYEEIYVKGGTKDYRIKMIKLTGKSQVVAN